MKTQDKLRKALRAKCGSRPDERFSEVRPRPVRRVSRPEVEEMFRTGLKITKREASPADVRGIGGCMDADGGTLSLAELAALWAKARLAGQEQDEAADDQEDDGLLSSSVREPLAAVSLRCRRLFNTVASMASRGRWTHTGRRTRTSTPKP